MTPPLRLLRGVVTALGTPLDGQDALHEAGMRRQIQMQLAAGVDGLLVLGSMGAMQLLPDDVCREAIRVTTDEVGGRIPIVVGCGDTSTVRTLARIRWAEASPVDGVAIVPPYFFKFTQTELAGYYRELAGSTSLPIYLYGNPAWTKHVLELPLIVELAKVPGIVGLKESGDLGTVQQCIEHFAGSDQFVVLSGLTTFADLALQLGAHGIVDGLFALAPEVGVALYRASRDGDVESAARARRTLVRLVQALQVDSLFAGFTAAMNLRGISGNFAIRPFSQSSPAGTARIEASLLELGLLAT